MWRNIMLCLLAGAVSCTGAKSDAEKNVAGEATDVNIPVADIRGQWLIENIVENDSSYVRPSEVEQGVTAYIDFRDDYTFGIVTNCNHIGGEYAQNNDSIHFADISTTEMACDNMAIEEMLKKVLPIVNTIDCINDSVARLNTEKGDSYIVLKKRNVALK